jgi:membrane fusion protein (multidrug efflux system)
MNRPVLWAACLVSILSFALSCSREQAEAKNLEQIYKEEGIPVRIRKIETQPFQQEMSFRTLLSGIKESVVYSLIVDEVEDVLVKVGDYVEENQVLLTFPTDNPATRYYQAKVAYENSKKAHERMKNLFNDGGISRQELDNAAAAFEVAQADWEAVQETVKVKAPISGYITKVDVRITDNVRRDEPLFTISLTDRMKAVVWISEREISDIRTGMPAYVLWNGRKIAGRVVQVDLAMDPDKRAFQAVIDLNNPEKILKPGIAADVKIISYTDPRAIVVRRQDLVQEEDSYFVYILNQDVAEKRAVKLGRSQDLDVQIIEGLEVGDELIVEGQLLLSPGTKVKVIQ